MKKGDNWGHVDGFQGLQVKYTKTTNLPNIIALVLSSEWGEWVSKTTPTVVDDTRMMMGMHNFIFYQAPNSHE